MEIERSPSVSKRGTSAKGEQDGSEQIRSSEAPPPVSAKNKEKANSSTNSDYNTLTTKYSSFTPPAGWILNNKEYVAKVANYIECSFYKDKKGQLLSFIE
jgi:hypothetical protein